MPRPFPQTIVLCIDGLDPAYVAATPTPAVDALSGLGFYGLGRAVVPTVTNVNNVSLATGAPPSVHGITANYLLDPQSGRETYLESSEFILTPTLIQRARQAGRRTAVLTAKAKLLALVGTGADYALSSESPDSRVVNAIGAPPGIYAPDVNLWLMRALGWVLGEMRPEFVYCATTDGMMHRHPPEAPASQRHVGALDAAIGRLAEERPSARILVTADHGMSHKSEALDLGRVLGAVGIEARAIPIIKDRYVVHHSNLGGAAYVHLGEPEALDEAISALRVLRGVEAVHPRVQAAERFDLMAGRIGDLLVLADGDTVFGTLDQVRESVDVRSHGSLHEAEVPILAVGPGIRDDYARNYDLTAGLDIV